MMGILRGSGSVAPDDVVEGYPVERRGLSGWIKKHPVIASVSITLLILGIITAIVVPITCSVHGCPPKKAEPAQVSTIYDDAPKRLIVAFLSDFDVDDIVPPILKQYTSRVKMLLSNIQILEAIDEQVLQLVIKEIKKRTDVEFLVRDFVLQAPTIVDHLGSGSGSGGSGRRRLLQSGSYTLNDTGLSNAWWFDKLNVTGAWQQLGVSASAPWTQNSDVVIAVTDSGAFTDHPDLQFTWWNNPQELDGDLADNDNNTFIDDFYGACFSTVLCSPTYLGNALNNVSRCGIGRNTSSWNGITDRTTHGTKIAGIIGATPNNGIGLAGIAPNLRQMILKVTDETLNSANPPYAYSDVVRAVDYGYGKGARIFSMSFGPNGRNSFNLVNKPGLDAAAAAYKTLFTKYSDALFVAAAGNEWTNLDGWKNANYSYPPCMVDTDNTVCVGGTNASDSIFYLYDRNQDIGTNYGASTVDMGAPGFLIYTTDIPYNGLYSTPTGTSFSTPMVAAVAGLVLTALGGQARATSQTPQLIKQILMTSGDPLPTALQGRFRSVRRLNAGLAVATAMTLATTNRQVMKLARNFSDVSTTVAFQGWEHYWYRKPNFFDIVLDPFNLGLLDYQIRNTNTSNFVTWRYGTGTLLMATAMMRIDTPGAYSIQARPAGTGMTPDRWNLYLGEVKVVFTNSTAELMFPTAGWYNMTLWLNSDWSNFNFMWLTPGVSGWWNPPWFWVLHEDPPSSRYYDPGMSYSLEPNPSIPRPAIWHVVWNESAAFDDFFPNGTRGFFLNNFDTRNYRTQTATLPDFSFASGGDLRNALYGAGNGPANNMTVVYGYARANLRPQPYSGNMAFRLQGPHTRLWIDGQQVFDFQSDTNLMIVSPCVTLRNNTAHEVFFYFAARLTSSNPVGLTWTVCTGPSAPPGPTGPYQSMTPSLATNYFWQTTSTATDNLPRGFRCDAWPTNQSVSNIGTTPPFGSPPVLTWVYPRDCLPAYRTPSGECRMSTRLVDLFPNITWNNWHIRCWTYYAGTLARGLTGSVVLSGPIFQHLGGVRIFEQFGDGINSYCFAPYNSRIAQPMYQLFVIEWVGLRQQWNRLAVQTVWNGTTSLGTAEQVITTDSRNMILPPGANASFAWRDVTSSDVINY